MKTEQQNKLWNELSEESKKRVLARYNEAKDYNDATDIDCYEDLFGEHNLNPKPQIKTWEDLKEIHPELAIELANMDCAVGKIFHKMSATLKIYKLIDLFYGGMVSEEEWWNDNTLKYYIKCNPHKSESSIECTYHASVKYFIAFHTQQQAEEFMSYKSNKRLVEQYYMM